MFPIIFLKSSKGDSANEKRRYICNVFSHELRQFSRNLSYTKSVLVYYGSATAHKKLRLGIYDTAILVVSFVIMHTTI